MLELIFPTPVWHQQVDSSGINDQIDLNVNDGDFILRDKWFSNVYMTTETFNEDIISDKKLYLLETIIDDCLVNYTDQLGYKPKPYTRTSWFSMYKGGEKNYAHVHNHNDADISGVYYYKTNGSDGDIYFKTPNPFLDSTKCFKSAGNPVSVSPKEGMLILFPGWLQHGVRTNITNDTKISLSFNIYYDNNSND